MSEVYLDRCPFCGGAAEIVMSENTQSPFLYYGECTKCGAHNNNKCESRALAVLYWNDFVKKAISKQRTAEMMSNLKPCPFCGSKKYLEVEEAYICVLDDWETHGYFVRCNHCDLMFGYHEHDGSHFMTPEAAAEAWNRRMYQD